MHTFYSLLTCTKTMVNGVQRHKPTRIQCTREETASTFWELWNGRTRGPDLVDLMKNDFSFLSGESQEQSPFKLPNNRGSGLSGTSSFWWQGGGGYVFTKKSWLRTVWEAVRFLDVPLFLQTAGQCPSSPQQGTVSSLKRIKQRVCLMNRGVKWMICAY